jgi:hypothetical protein
MTDSRATPVERWVLLLSGTYWTAHLLCWALTSWGWA